MHLTKARDIMAEAAWNAYAEPAAKHNSGLGGMMKY